MESGASAAAAAAAAAAARREQLLERAADNGHSVMVLAPQDFVHLLRDVGGGAASGNAALAASLHAQSQTIAASNEQMVALIGEIGRLSKRCAELETQQLSIRQFDGALQLERDKLLATAGTHKEMLGIIKLAGAAALAHYMGPNAPDLSALLAPAAEAPTLAVPGAPATEAPAHAPAAPKGKMPDTLAGAVKAVGQTLSSATLDKVLGVAERPNPRLPGNIPTLLAAVQILVGCLDDETLQAVKNDLGPELMQHVYMLAMAPRSPAETPPAA